MRGTGQDFLLGRQARTDHSFHLSDPLTPRFQAFLENLPASEADKMLRKHSHLSNSAAQYLISRRLGERLDEIYEEEGLQDIEERDWLIEQLREKAAEMIQSGECSDEISYPLVEGRAILNPKLGELGGVAIHQGAWQSEMYEDKTTIAWAKGEVNEFLSSKLKSAYIADALSHMLYAQKSFERIAEGAFYAFADQEGVLHFTVESEENLTLCGKYLENPVRSAFGQWGGRDGWGHKECSSCCKVRARISSQHDSHTGDEIHELKNELQSEVAEGLEKTISIFKERVLLQERADAFMLRQAMANLKMSTLMAERIMREDTAAAKLLTSLSETDRASVVSHAIYHTLELQKANSPIRSHVEKLLQSTLKN